MQTACIELKGTPLGDLSLADDYVRRRGLRRIQNYVKTIPHQQAMVLVDEICAKLDAKPVAQKSVLGSVFCVLAPSLADGDKKGG